MSWTQEARMHALPLPNQLPAPAGEKKRCKGHREKRTLLAIWTVDKMWSPLESGRHHRETVRGEGRMGVSWEALSLSLCLCLSFSLHIPPELLKLHNPAVTLSSFKLSVFIILVSGQEFPAEDFSTYYVTCYSTKSYSTKLSPLFFVLILFI